MIVVRPDDMVIVRFYLENGTSFSTPVRVVGASVFPILEDWRLKSYNAFHSAPIYVTVSTCRGVFYYRWSSFANRFIAMNNNTRQFRAVRAKYDEAYKKNMYAVSSRRYKLML